MELRQGKDHALLQSNKPCLSSVGKGSDRPYTVDMVYALVVWDLKGSVLKCMQDLIRLCVSQWLQRYSGLCGKRHTADCALCQSPVYSA